MGQNQTSCNEAVTDLSGALQDTMGQREEETLPHPQCVQAHMLVQGSSHMHSPIPARTKAEIQASQLSSPFPKS